MVVGTEVDFFGFVDVPATGVDGCGVGAAEPLSLCPPVRKFEETALAPAAAVGEFGAMAA